jgi:hypothetical protein
VTQHGSFPGRPRGRRARHQADVPDPEGYAGPPPDEREFPDLPPIRPRDAARPRDGRGPGDWPGQQAQPGQPGQYGQQGRGGGYQAAGGGYGQSGPNQVNPGYGAGPPGGGQYGGFPGGNQAEPGQAPWADEEWPAPQSAGRPGSAPSQPPQARHAQPPQAPAEPEWRGAQRTKQEEDVPSWAEPDSVEAFSARWHRRGLDSRDDRRSGRRSRRRVLIAGSGVAVVVIAVAVYFLLGSNGSSANLGLGSLVTQFLPGEVQTIPDACSTVPKATLSQYLPHSPNEAAPPLNSGTDSQCSWTMDDPPTYRVLEVQIEAYTPSALVANSNGTGLVPAGNGSATYAAEAALASYDYNLVNPGAKSGQPTATVAEITGMPGGNGTSAFSATQVFDRAGAITDEASVYVRYRNVIIIAVMEGLDRSSTTKKYGPVVMSDLTTAAKAVAKQVAGQIVH